MFANRLTMFDTNAFRVFCNFVTTNENKLHLFLVPLVCSSGRAATARQSAHLPRAQSCTGTAQVCAFVFCLTLHYVPIMRGIMLPFLWQKLNWSEGCMRSCGLSLHSGEMFYVANLLQVFSMPHPRTCFREPINHFL